VQLRELLGDITYDVLFHRVLEGSTARSVDSDAELRKQLADLKWLWTEGERERSRRKAVNLKQFMMHELYIYARVVDRLKKYEIAVDEMVLLEQFIKRYEAGLKADLVRLNRQNARSYTQEQLRELIEGRYPAELFYWMTPERQQRVLQTLVELQRDIDAQNNRSQDDDLVKQGEGSL